MLKNFFAERRAQYRELRAARNGEPADIPTGEAVEIDLPLTGHE